MNKEEKQKIEDETIENVVNAMMGTLHKALTRDFGWDENMFVVLKLIIVKELMNKKNKNDEDNKGELNND